MKNRIIYLDQVIGPLSIDIINFFCSKYNEVICLYGEQISTHNKISNDARKIKFNRYFRSSTIRRLSSWLQFFVRTFFYLIFKKKDYYIFAVSNPPLNTFTCLTLNYLFGIKYSLLVYDLYPQAFIEYGYAKEKSIIVRIWERLNQKAYKRAANIYTISNSIADVISKNEHKISTVQMWADTVNIKPVDKNENWFRKKLNLEDKFVVLYSGNFGETHDLESIINAATDLKDQDDIHFLFIGDGRKKSMLSERVYRDNLKNVTILPFQDDKTFPYSITSGDVSIVTLDEKAASLSVPSKIFYYMASGSAIITIAREGSELANLVKKYDCGFNISQHQKGSLADEIINLSRNKDRIDKFRKNARVASNYHSPDNVKSIII